MLYLAHSRLLLSLGLPSSSPVAGAEKGVSVKAPRPHLPLPTSEGGAREGLDDSMILDLAQLGSLPTENLDSKFDKILYFNPYSIQGVPYSLIAQVNTYAL